jgi:nucleoside-diphosphate-sugar epimerase
MLIGGAGFIGSWLARKLEEQNHSVLIYDAFVQYISPLETDYNQVLKDRLQGVEAEVVRGDIRDSYHLRKAVSEFQPHSIVHLAAIPIANMTDVHSEEACSSIIQGTANCLEAVRDTKWFKRFVYVSSSMIYGDFDDIPCKEHSSKQPKELYGGFKYAGEIITETYVRRFDFESCIIRPSSVYGLGDVNRRVIQTFIERARKKEPIVIHNDNKFDFTYVKDIADGLATAATSPYGRNKVFNVTYGEGRTLKEVAEIVCQYFPTEIVYQPREEEHRPVRGRLDTSSAYALLEYEPKFNLEKGIHEYVFFLNSAL